MQMPMCEVKGCDLTSRMHMFGHDLCWHHYCKWMEDWRTGKFEANMQAEQKVLDFGDMQGYNI